MVPRFRVTSEPGHSGFRYLSFNRLSSSQTEQLTKDVFRARLMEETEWSVPEIIVLFRFYR